MSDFERLDRTIWPGPDQEPPFEVKMRRFFRDCMESLAEGMREAGRAYGDGLAAVGSALVAARTRESRSNHATSYQIYIDEINDLARDFNKLFDKPIRVEVPKTARIHGPRREQPFSKRGPKRISAPDSVRGCGIVSDRVGYRHGRR